MIQHSVQQLHDVFKGLSAEQEEEEEEEEEVDEEAKIHNHKLLTRSRVY